METHEAAAELTTTTLDGAEGDISGKGVSWAGGTGVGGSRGGE